MAIRNVNVFIKPDSLLYVVPEDLTEVVVAACSGPDHLFHPLRLEEHVVIGLHRVLEGLVTDELWILQLFEQWYGIQVGLVSAWLAERPALHPQQVACLSIILKKMYSDFELQGVIDDKLNSKVYQNVASRMHTEEATCSLLLAQQDTGGGDEGSEEGTRSGKSKGVPAKKCQKLILNYVTSVGNIFGRGIGELSTKLGGASSWF
ncbi:hypothetical protein MSG28_011407 [Choristoneura fumiferana]|uniref:Uncharacterized protein n=1 Tax=Choristoneura fumiferana TaxID=7141 RepID=A0ACC0JN95_CHOFU|nr:hypothetical protein MSG28_011407 [Choristoneura fumiferana]